jgi:6-phosphogluconate dehydrogenase
VQHDPRFIIVMGVAGSGKTTIGRGLAARLGVPFHDGDDFHPPANIAKMAAGIPLRDEDRADWLATLADLIRDGLARGRNGVIACSALKKKYRDILRIDARRVRFVYLQGDHDAIRARMQQRVGHFMRPDMLRGQFDDLEEPARAIRVNAVAEPDAIIDRIMEKLMEKQYALGIMGLGVMGRSLTLNFERHGYPVVGYDPNPHLPPDFPASVVDSPAALVAALDSPRVILIMVPAGKPVDIAIDSLKDSLQAGDIIIDGGNSWFLDTERRAKELAEAGIHFVGMGVSGGESGALWGPSLMPGGAQAAWETLAPMLRDIAAVAPDGEKAVTWVGPGGAGHYVKMVHNGIEYGDMELIAEIYDLLHRGAGLPNEELADLFADWNEGELRSFLIEITAKVLRYVDKETGRSLLDLIVDIAGQKGTGRWTSQIALEVGTPMPTINAAVVMRLMSADKDVRVLAAARLGGTTAYAGDRAQLAAAAYAQGMDLLQTASAAYGWSLNIAAIVRIWRAGCIIRAQVLDSIAAAFERQPGLPNLLLDGTIATAIEQRQADWRAVVIAGVKTGIPLPALAASLGYFDALRSERLPANLIQAQRDFFGAHTYHRIDRDGIFHTEWE